MIVKDKTGTIFTNEFLGMLTIKDLVEKAAEALGEAFLDAPLYVSVGTGLEEEDQILKAIPFSFTAGVGESGYPTGLLICIKDDDE